MAGEVEGKKGLNPRGWQPVLVNQSSSGLAFVISLVHTEENCATVCGSNLSGLLAIRKKKPMLKA